jgi:hypothetical protein
MRTGELSINAMEEETTHLPPSNVPLRGTWQAEAAFLLPWGKKKIIHPAKVGRLF